jgi:MerR family redox-sensitive transcriptional activator SoxR
MSDATLSIGELARRAGISVSAIRYYERRGLLPPPERMSGQRRYGGEAVERLRIVEVAKQAGFSLAEARELLESVDAGAPAHERLRALAARKLPEVEAQIERAHAMRAWLATAGACACACESLHDCALFLGQSRA